MNLNFVYLCELKLRVSHHYAELDVPVYDCVPYKGNLRAIKAHKREMHKARKRKIDIPVYGCVPYKGNLRAIKAHKQKAHKHEKESMTYPCRHEFLITTICAQLKPTSKKHTNMKKKA